MSVKTEMLGGRLPLLDPQALSIAQKEIYDRLNTTMNISARFLDLHDGEEKDTSLSERVRQVVILSVGAVWKSEYELYAHTAAAREAGISEDAIRTLAVGRLPNDLSDQEKIAQNFARQLSAEHRVDGALYGAAEHAFGQQGLVDIIYLTGIYHIVCALLNAFEIPVPGSEV